MTDWVLDASAVLAYLKNEPGREAVESALTLSIISAVNASEVVAKLISHGVEAGVAVELVRELDCEIVSVDESLSLRAGELAATTQPKGLSLGDRVCLALAEREGVPALTADLAWAELGLDVKVSLIR